MLKELEVPDLQVVKELNAGVTLGQIALSNSEQMMFAGTSEVGKPGCVRAYSFPLTGDYLEVPYISVPLDVDVTLVCVEIKLIGSPRLSLLSRKASAFTPPVPASFVARSRVPSSTLALARL